MYLLRSSDWAGEPLRMLDSPLSEPDVIDWDPDPSAAANLLRAVSALTSATVKFKRVSVTLDQDLSGVPFLYLTGQMRRQRTRSFLPLLRSARTMFDDEPLAQLLSDCMSAVPMHRDGETAGSADSVESIALEISAEDMPDGFAGFVQDLVAERFPEVAVSIATYATGFGVGDTIFRQDPAEHSSVLFFCQWCWFLDYSAAVVAAHFDHDRVFESQMAGVGFFAGGFLL